MVFHGFCANTSLMPLALVVLIGWFCCFTDQAEIKPNDWQIDLFPIQFLSRSSDLHSSQWHSSSFSWNSFRYWVSEIYAEHWQCHYFIDNIYFKIIRSCLQSHPVVMESDVKTCSHRETRRNERWTRHSHWESQMVPVESPQQLVLRCKAQVSVRARLWHISSHHCDRERPAPGAQQFVKSDWSSVWPCSFLLCHFVFDSMTSRVLAGWKHILNTCTVCFVCVTFPCNVLYC